MSAYKKLSIKNQEFFFRVIGFNENESMLLTQIINNPQYTLEKYSYHLNVTSTIFTKLLNKLSRNHIIAITENQKLRITSQFALQQSREFDQLAKDFSYELKETRFLISNRYIEEIENIFKGEGFRINKKSQNKLRFQFRGHIPENLLVYQFVASKFYKLGVFYISQDLLQALKVGDDPSYVAFVLHDMFNQLEDYHNCIGSVIIFSPRTKSKTAFTLKTHLFRRSSQNHLSNNHFRYIFHDEQKIHAELLNIISEIDLRKDSVDSRFTSIKSSIKIIKDIIAESTMMISQLNSVTAGKYLHSRSKEVDTSKYMPYIKTVIDREQRNLNIFDRKFEEERARIERKSDGYDKRLLLPRPQSLANSIKNLNILKDKFQPIRHELNSLIELLLYPYIQGQDPMQVNPFILTEPNDMESFTVNQESIKISSVNFFKRLTKSVENIRFVVGKAGSGKTHSLRNIFYINAKLENFWPIYIDCPMKYDIINSLFYEIVKEANFPNKLRNFISSIGKQKVDTEYGLINVLKTINNLLKEYNYKGLVLLIDELENALPYTYDLKYKKNLSPKAEPALALNQLKDILSSELVNDIGFIFAFREHILQEIKDGLNIKNFKKYIVIPAELSLKHFKELINLRYETWDSKILMFNTNVLEKIMKITNTNFRYSIQYYRALYELANSNNRKRITLKLLDQIGEIPLFEY